MARVTTEALALRRIPFGETSQIAEFLSRDRGRISLILKGVHRPKSRKGGGVDLLDRCVLTWTRRRGSRSLAPLVERKVLSHHPGLRGREDLLRAGLYLVELLRFLAPEGQPQAGVFDLSVAYLKALDAQPPREAVSPIVFALEGGLLRMTGFEPVLDRCVSCNRRPDGFRSLRCVPEHGGIVCSACREGPESGDPPKESFPLTSTSVRIIQGLAGADPRGVSELRMPENIENDVRRFYYRTLLHVLERAPRCMVAPSRN